MKNIMKVAFLSSVITAAMVYVILEWQPLRPEATRPPEVSWASSAANTAAPAPAPANLTDDERNNIDLYEKYSPGVVNITNTTLSYDFFLRPVPESGTGSGAILDTEGHIVTNYHVVENAQRLEVTLADKSKHNARISGTDPNTDLAVIQIQASRNQLTPIPLGTSKGLQVGQKVLAIGNPFGLERTLTTGIVSAVGRPVQVTQTSVLEDMVQTDAAINHGNSGGPLLNSSGEIIGITSVILSPSDSGNIGIGFAIPADTVRRITSDLISIGHVRRPYLGVVTISLKDYPGLADALRLNTDRGLLIVQLLSNGPAARAGIRGPREQVRIGNRNLPVGGDVILALQGREVDSRSELTAAIDRLKPGDRVSVTVLRDGRKMDISAVLEEAPPR